MGQKIGRDSPGRTYVLNGPFDTERYASVRDIAAEMMGGQPGAEVSYFADLLAGETGHATPKVDVRGVLFGTTECCL